MEQEERKKGALERFNEQLGEDEKKLIKDYLQEKSMESLSKCFENMVKETTNAAKTDKN